MNARALLSGIAVAGLVASGSVAVAGTQVIDEISVDTVNRVVSGSMGSIRNSVDGTQWIECWSQGVAGGSLSAGCSARSLSGTNVFCNTDSGNLITMINTIKGDSWVEFRWGTDLKCTVVKVINSSKYEPKEP